MSQNYAHMLTERFLRYAAVNTQSDGSAGTGAQHAGQLELARMLSGELEDMGLENVHVDEHAIVTAVLPATMRGVPRIGFVAHLDTVDVALSPEVHPRIQRFDGGDVCLNPERDIWLAGGRSIPNSCPTRGRRSFSPTEPACSVRITRPPLPIS